MMWVAIQVKREAKLLLQLRQDLICVFGPRQSVHNFQFRELDVYGVVVFAEKYTDVILENSWTTLNN